MQFHTIITHESPDLDAMLCCYLLRKYGNKRYPEINTALISFYPAGCLPEGKTVEALEKEGIVVVDMGGGRLDTHPDGQFLRAEKLFLSAANLVAEEIGVADKPSLRHLLEFVRLHDSMGKSISSRNPIDHLVCLPNLVRGGTLHFKQNFLEMVDLFMDVFGAIELATEVNDTVFFEENSPCLIGIQGNTAMIPPMLHLPSLFAAYLASRYLQKEILIESQPSLLQNCRIWTQLSKCLKDWGLAQYPEHKKIILFIEKLKPNSYLLNSSDSLDQTVSLPNIIKGLYLLFQQDIQKALAPIFLLFDSILAYERNWQQAILEYHEKKQIYEAGEIKIVAITAETGAVMKVARWEDKPDLIVFQDSLESNVIISLSATGRLRNYSLQDIAAKIRTAEIMKGSEQAEPVAPEKFFQIGDLGGWFLHQSEKLLLHGSPKARRTPSLLPFAIIVKLVLSQLPPTKIDSQTSYKRE